MQMRSFRIYHLQVLKYFYLFLNVCIFFWDHKMKSIDSQAHSNSLSIQVWFRVNAAYWKESAANDVTTMWISFFYFYAFLWQSYAFINELFHFPIRWREMHATTFEATAMLLLLAVMIAGLLRASLGEGFNLPRLVEMRFHFHSVCRQMLHFL